MSQRKWFGSLWHNKDVPIGRVRLLLSQNQPFRTLAPACEGEFVGGGGFLKVDGRRRAGRIRTTELQTLSEMGGSDGTAAVVNRVG